MYISCFWKEGDVASRHTPAAVGKISPVWGCPPVVEIENGGALRHPSCHANTHAPVRGKSSSIIRESSLCCLRTAEKKNTPC